MANVLLINPNTHQALTDKAVNEARSVAHSSWDIQGFTPHLGVLAIESEDDADISTKACLSELGDDPGHWDGVIVACYSAHPLVEQLQSIWQRPVVGIMQASWWAAKRMGLTPSIVTSSAGWIPDLQRNLTHAGYDGSVRSIQSSVTAIVEHPAQASSALEKVVAEESRTDVAICLGCAAMSGLEKTFVAGDVPVIDGVKAAVQYLAEELSKGSGRVAL